MLGRITPVLLTFNEAPNIARTLAPLSWAREIVVVDSGSTDGTQAIAARHPAVRVVHRPFTTHADQWNFAVSETGITSEWVLALDADFVLPDAAVAEIAALDPGSPEHGYWAAFDYCIDGVPLRGAAYPPVVVLYRRAQARYRQDGHTQRVEVPAPLGRLTARFRHDDRKPLSQWLAAQSRYMRLEAAKLRQTPVAALPLIDRVRLALVVMPAAMFFYCYVVRGGILDGPRGLAYALQRAAAELILSLYLVSWRAGQTAPGGPADASTTPE
jgi:glycosyltransferase involved in cell wall biosynthesis